jgi:hypothetical protein
MAKTGRLLYGNDDREAASPDSFSGCDRRLGAG